MIVEPLRVLIVEDEAIVVMQIEMILEDAGHNVVGTAMSASEAIALIPETKPELVLIDLRLKEGSSGLDVARAIRERSGTMAVFLTANAGELSDDLEGATAVISKPFNAMTLEGSMSYLEECVHRPPPLQAVPKGMRLAPAYHASLDEMRTAG